MSDVLKYVLENWEFVAAAAYAAIEFYLGKTEKVKSGSVIELLLGIATMWKSKAKDNG